MPPAAPAPPAPPSAPAPPPPAELELALDVAGEVELGSAGSGSSLQLQPGATASTVRTAAPHAVEGMSYGMPYYNHHGRLVYFAAFTNHVSLFAWGPALKAYEKEVERYRTSKGTLQFALGSKIPVALVRKLVKVRARENEAKQEAKQAAKRKRR